MYKGEGLGKQYFVMKKIYINPNLNKNFSSL